MTTSEYNQELFAIHHITEADIQSNRQGKLSENQRLKIRYSLRKRAIAILLTVILLLYAAWGPIQAFTHLPLRPLPSVQLTGFLALLVYLVIIVPLINDRLRTPLELLEGSVRLQVLTTRRRRISGKFLAFFLPSERRLTFQDEYIPTILAEGTRYRFFLLNDVVIAIEALSPPTSTPHIEHGPPRYVHTTVKLTHLFWSILFVVLFVIPVAVIALLLAST